MTRGFAPCHDVLVTRVAMGDIQMQFTPAGAVLADVIIVCTDIWSG